MKKTFMYENKLQSLPIPHLQDTCQTLLAWIKPIVSKEVYRQTEETVRQFLAPHGAGEKLQAQLHRWNQTEVEGWLKGLWDESYLVHRDPLPITMNFNVLLESILDPGEKMNYAKVAAEIGVRTAQFYHDIIDEVVPPEKMRGLPVDMRQFKKFFRSARIPKKDKDMFYIAPNDKKDNHIILLHKNNMILLPITNELGEIYCQQSIEEEINRAMEATTEASHHVGLYTVSHRNKAAEIVRILQEDRQNKKNLQKMYDALLIVSIDEESESSIQAIRRLMLETDNKFFDKTVQVVLMKNGEIGFNMEHTAVDGTSIATFIKYINRHLRQRKAPETSPNKVVASYPLQWKLTEQTKAMLEQVANAYEPLQNNIALLFHTFETIGAKHIKEMKLSPDAFFHLALQIAYYKTYSRFDSVYEPVAMRTFRGGRTECARATTEEKCRVVYVLEDENVSDRELLTLIQEASDAHSERLRMCQEGYGVERHLFGLEKMYEKFSETLHLSEKPAIYSDEGYKRMRYDALSTSGMVYDNAVARMFAPTVEHGHGVAYMMHEDSITVSISSYRHNEEEGKQLLAHLEGALQELTDVVQSGQEQKER